MIVVVPEVLPDVTTPPELIVATEVLLDVQVPPDGLPVKV